MYRNMDYRKINIPRELVNKIIRYQYREYPYMEELKIFLLINFYDGKRADKLFDFWIF